MPIPRTNPGGYPPWSEVSRRNNFRWFWACCLQGDGNLLQKLQSLEFLGIMGTTAGSAAMGIPVMCNGANLGYRRAAFIAGGGYSGNLQFGSGDDQF